ncbi:helix-turn-helix domain-containing protein [Streptomyces sp. NPDC056638]|uniref:helix-turn-helix domain-containing protein n=1 Tax=Streptomyces sp. NPDC056638 TaxID=3345887 RepID=UPI0036BC6C24
MEADRGRAAGSPVRPATRIRAPTPRPVAARLSVHARGRVGGRRPRLAPDQAALAQQLYDTREKTAQQIADLFGVPRSTVYGHLDKTKTVPRRRSAKEVLSLYVALPGGIAVIAVRRSAVRDRRKWADKLPDAASLHGLGSRRVAPWHPVTEPPQKPVGGPRRPLLPFRRPCKRTRRWYP